MLVAYTNGFRAFQLGGKLNNNPYSSEFDINEWERGYKDANILYAHIDANAYKGDL